VIQSRKTAGSGSSRPHQRKKMALIAYRGWDAWTVWCIEETMPKRRKAASLCLPEENARNRIELMITAMLHKMDDGVDEAELDPIENIRFSISCPVRIGGEMLCQRQEVSRRFHEIDGFSLLMGSSARIYVHRKQKPQNRNSRAGLTADPGSRCALMMAGRFRPGAWERFTASHGRSLCWLGVNSNADGAEKKLLGVGDASGPVDVKMAWWRGGGHVDRRLPLAGDFLKR